MVVAWTRCWGMKEVNKFEVLRDRMGSECWLDGRQEGVEGKVDSQVWTE